VAFSVQPVVQTIIFPTVASNWSASLPFASWCHGHAATWVDRSSSRGDAAKHERLQHFILFSIWVHLMAKLSTTDAKAIG
jgi:hypothetical protein